MKGKDSGNFFGLWAKIYTVDDNSVPLRHVSHIDMHPTGKKFCINCIARLPTTNHAPIAWKLSGFSRNIV